MPVSRMGQTRRNSALDLGYFGSPLSIAAAEEGLLRVPVLVLRRHLPLSIG